MSRDQLLKAAIDTMGQPQLHAIIIQLRRELIMEIRKHQKLLTVGDLAKRWNVAAKTIRNNLCNKKLKLGTKVFGHSLRFSVDEILKHERENRFLP